MSAASAPATESQAVTPELSLDNCAKALEWYRSVMKADVKKTYKGKDDKIMHSVVEFANKGQVYMCDNMTEGTVKNEQICKTYTHLQFNDDDSAAQLWDSIVKFQSDSGDSLATSHFKIEMQFKQQFWGQKYGRFIDPFGYCWSIGGSHSKPDSSSSDSVSDSGKKRDLAESESTDEKGTESTTPPLKKQRLEGEIRERESMQGLFMCLGVGKSGSGADVESFADACDIGYEATTKLLNANEELTENCRGCIAISPDNPDTHTVARYMPGFLFGNTVDLSKYETDKIKRRVLPKNKWFVKMHIGPYEGLKNAWQGTIKEIEDRKFKIVGDICCFEQYLNKPTKVTPDQLKTEIWIAIQD